MLKRMVPSVYYETLQDGFDLFVGCLGFSIVHQDDNFAVVLRENAKLYLVLDAKAALHQGPLQITMETGTIEADYDAICAKDPTFLDPDYKVIRATPWGGREFAVRDATGVSVLFRQLIDSYESGGSLS